MKNIKLYILLSAFVSFSEQSINYRLPKNSIPYHYKLKFVPHLIPTNFTFNGEAEIFLEILNRTKNLTLHSSNLQIHQEKTILIGEDDIFYPDQQIFQKEPQFFILIFSLELTPGNYKLILKFTGALNDNYQGFFRDSYLNENNETIYLAATQFEVTHARKAFPCWDEPEIKATFDISIKHFPNFTSLSNMPIKKIINESEIDGKIWTNFQTTPLMSTFLVCFTISDFANFTNPDGNFSIWTRKDSLDFVLFGYKVALKAFPILEKYTGISYPLPKLDIIVIPGYKTGAMENWGLIVFGEHLILRNENSMPFENLDTSKFMVHEIAHQWIGNLVSPAWWKDIWITEGLPTYLHYFITAKVINVPRFMEYFVVQSNFQVFDNDDNSSSMALFRNINTEKDAWGIMSSVHYKAAAIMHMLSGLLSEKVFHAGIKKMLQEFMFKTISTDEFWQIMQESLAESKIVNFDVKMKIDPFISQLGYPVIKVSRNYTTGVVKLSQYCSNCLKNYHYKKESKWWIPINFATKSSLNFSSTFATHWMNPEEDLIIEGIDPHDWIIINIQSSAYYRVNYDERNWKRIGKFLNSEEFSKIHVLNRAQILEDAFWLFKQQKIEKDLFIYVISYLERELDLIPWVPGDKILFHLYETMDRKLFKKIALRLINPLFNNTGENDKHDDDLFTIYKRSTATYWKCGLEKSSCNHQH